MTALTQSLFELPVEEKLQIISYLWDSIDAEKMNIPIPKEVLDEMERRVDEYLKDGDPGEPWEVVRKRIEAKL